MNPRRLHLEQLETRTVLSATNLVATAVNLGPLATRGDWGVERTLFAVTLPSLDAVSRRALMEAPEEFRVHLQSLRIGRVNVPELNMREVLARVQDRFNWPFPAAGIPVALPPAHAAGGGLSDGGSGPTGDSGGRPDRHVPPEGESADRDAFDDLANPGQSNPPGTRPGSGWGTLLSSGLTFPTLDTPGWSGNVERTHDSMAAWHADTAGSAGRSAPTPPSTRQTDTPSTAANPWEAQGHDQSWSDDSGISPAGDPPLTERPSASAESPPGSSMATEASIDSSRARRRESALPHDSSWWSARSRRLLETYFLEFGESVESQLNEPEPDADEATEISTGEFAVADQDGGLIELIAAAFPGAANPTVVSKLDATTGSTGNTFAECEVTMDAEVGLFQAFEIATDPTETPPTPPSYTTSAVGDSEEMSEGEAAETAVPQQAADAEASSPSLQTASVPVFLAAASLFVRRRRKPPVVS